jgi:hypothetical protein
MFRFGPVPAEQARCARLVEMSSALNNAEERTAMG